MRQLRSLISASATVAVAYACAAEQAPATSPRVVATDAVATTNAASSEAVAPDQRCTEGAAPQLTSYLEAKVPATYWLDLTFDGGEWRPASFLPMPHHHATRLELANVADFPELARTHPRVRVTLELTAREVRQVPGQHRWRTTYHARLLTVCPAPAPSRP